MAFHLRPVIHRHLVRSFSTTPSRLNTIAKITLIGRLAAQPELVPTASGRDIIRYSLATDSGSRENRHTSWWKVSSFLPEGPIRDLVLSLGKGSMVYMEGDARMQKYDNKEGTLSTALSITQRHIQILQKKDAMAEGEGQDGEDSTRDS